ncbi:MULTISPECIES: MerR family transcriptional regulator [Aerococcus]|uniref:MerR family transcriptional regulator n=2 Tax=Aerococcus TaxID=1375 RepID=A0A178HCK1_9LACT|nr:MULTISPECIES: MerR family transcriptional regulator [Aerococcus]KAA9220430.1 MerR family transcriptional regulator [Aerococcus loyolae]KAA9265562.1 MerR family transcriptional regulator [Aerococcus loyolae]MCY3025630.1 MerR family transcriptional regulator [Aerococcus loyolae]MCY3027277.1 MerR family transcriptional regulator [Aerococcus loyolae]MCY3028899.1 MerR family transcriptional regulator [Aerococcus loyolae]
MKTVKEVSELAGISIRTLHYYDKINLLKPSKRTASGYRLYSHQDLKKLQYILLFKELEFSLKEIKEIINSKNFDKDLALDQQIQLLTLKKEHLENLILFAKGIKVLGVDSVNFQAFDRRNIDHYTQQAKDYWGDTKEYRHYQERQSQQSNIQKKTIHQQLMMIFVEFSQIKSQNYKSQNAQKLVKKLQDFISDHFYPCSNDILMELGKMYASGGDFTKNIDDFAGEGTAKFVQKAISYYCQ